MEEFLATDVRGRVQLRDRVLTAKPVTFNTASGAVLASLTLDTRSPNSYPLASMRRSKDRHGAARFFRVPGVRAGLHHLQAPSGVTRAQVDLDAPDARPDPDLDRLTCTLDLASTMGT